MNPVSSRNPVLPGLPPQGRHRDAADPAKTLDAARQFEALLLSQMLKSAREAGASGWGQEGEDHSGDSVMEMAEQQISTMLAASGGMGLSRLVVQGLSKPVVTVPASAAAVPSPKGVDH